MITYSKNVFLPITNLCRNRCGYCSFRREISHGRIISRAEVLSILKHGAEAGCTEALFSLGESPWEVQGFEALMASVGISDLIDYLVELCELAIEHGLLPHTNAGVLSKDDLTRLAPYNASMGLMLETTANVAAHDASPGKNPDLRQSFIAEAGRLMIPFTTGLLIGIGESWMDRANSLKVIADLHRSFGHIQEVIIQPLDPKPGTAFEAKHSPGIDELCYMVRLARKVLPKDVAVQVPPNLVDPLKPINAGANDLGGLSPVTPDWINPDKPWPKLEDLLHGLKGYDLRERLPVYPRYVSMGWHGRKTSELVKMLAGRDGLRRKEYLQCSELIDCEEKSA